MQIHEKKLRDIISQQIKKHMGGVNETDLVASDKSSWENKRAEFKNLVTNLIQNIETDDYDDASGDISKTMGILKTWKSRIDKGLMDNSNFINEENNDVAAYHSITEVKEDVFVFFQKVIALIKNKYKFYPDYKNELIETMMKLIEKTKKTTDINEIKKIVVYVKEMGIF